MKRFSLCGFWLLTLCIAVPAFGQTQPATCAGPAPRTGTLSQNHNAKLPTIFLIGDSTVKNGRDTGGDGLWGWGHPIADFFDASKVNVENQALGGTSSRSYYLSNWPGVSQHIKPGDFVIMQFGHNDGGGMINVRSTLRGNGEETQQVTNARGASETVHTFGWYIRQYIAETKAKGATPIVCSLIPRNDWANGKVNRAAASYGGWAAEAAKQSDALFIDLNGIIADHYDKLGEEAVKPLYPKEHTHTGWRGAVLNAQCVIEGIKGLKDKPLDKYLSEKPEPKKPASDPTDG